MYYLPFALLLGLAAVLAVGAERGIQVRLRGTRAGSVLTVMCLSGLSLVLILFAGLRATSVGRDTAVMVRHFDRIYTGDLKEALARSVQEAGYTALMFVLRNSTADYRWFLTVVSGITVLACIAVLAHHSRSLPISIVVYIGLGAYLAPLNIMRQGVAMALCFGTWSFVRRGRYATACFLALVAIQFHVSAVFAILAIVLLRKAVPTRTWMALITCITGLVAVMGGRLGLSWLGLLNYRFVDYVEQGQSTGGGTAVMLVLFIVLIYGTYTWARTANKDCQHAWMMLSIAPIFMAFGLHVVPAGRLELYFSLYATLVIPAFLHARANSTQKGFAVIAVLGYMIVYLTFWGGFLPYYGELSDAGGIVVASALFVVAFWTVAKGSKLGGSRCSAVGGRTLSVIRPGSTRVEPQVGAPKPHRARLVV